MDVWVDIQIFIIPTLIYEYIIEIYTIHHYGLILSPAFEKAKALGTVSVSNFRPGINCTPNYIYNI